MDIIRSANTNYCWFGRNPKSQLIEKCINSWRNYCPDYEIKEWNEDNWDVGKYQYAKEAYREKKWAFVSDVARLDILLHNGGIYLDTDVEILKANPFERYLKYESVLCFENARNIQSGLFFASNPNSELCRELLKPYTHTVFESSTCIVNSKMNEPVIRHSLPDLKWNANTQVFDNIYIIGCNEYSTLMKHYGTRSWCDSLPNYRLSKPNYLKNIMRNPNIFEMLESSKRGRKLLPIYTFLAYDLQDLGPTYFIKLNINKLIKR